MDVKQVVAEAKNYVKSLYEDEQISNIGLEELEYDDSSKVWSVTIGFSRPWHFHKEVGSLQIGSTLRGLMEHSGKPLERSYKVVRISNNGDIISLRDRLN